MTNEERAQIARENGAKSKGPVTPEGKAKSSRNAIKSGDYATNLALFVPPHSAVLCNEDRQAYASLIDDLIDTYEPVNSLALSIVQGIAIARWEIIRLRTCITTHWNLALIQNAQKPSTLIPELAEVQAVTNASGELYASSGAVRHINRQIDQLELRITRLERRLKFVQVNYPKTAEKRTAPIEAADVENTPLTPAAPVESMENEPPIYITENKPAVIEAYKMQFPGRKIVILNPDHVAKGIEIDDDMPVAPRKVA
ncbi:MAG: hypothetical protein HYX27_04570 [Acidobacteria bacterium]|nr:hypothetical protein [Acidobacteriota bacterium]